MQDLSTDMAQNSTNMAQKAPLLQIEGLCVYFRMYQGDADSFFSAKKRDSCVLYDLSLSVDEGELVALVGASGSGKSVLADAIMGIFEPNSTVSGAILFEGKQLDAQGIGELRGNGISYVPQSLSSLDPLMRVGKFVSEGRFREIGAGAAKHSSEHETKHETKHAAKKEWKAKRRQRQQELFARYHLDESVANMYPHELSGGMARRVLLCSALIDDPKLLIADEPTSGLDRELALAALKDFRSFADNGGGVLLITHDIELALLVADRVAIFKDGSIVEEAAVESFASPDLLETDYARALWHALPEHEFACKEKAFSC